MTARSFSIKQKKENKLFININNHLSMNIRLKTLEKELVRIIHVLESKEVIELGNEAGSGGRDNTHHYPLV